MTLLILNHCHKNNYHLLGINLQNYVNDYKQIFIFQQQSCKIPFPVRDNIVITSISFVPLSSLPDTYFF
jgi:hypothetical protein